MTRNSMQAYKLYNTRAIIFYCKSLSFILIMDSYTTSIPKRNWILDMVLGLKSFNTIPLC